MAVLKNVKRELFAQEIAKGSTITDAYATAGYKPDDGNASKMASHPEVQARVQEITGKAAEKAGVTVERILAELAKLGFSNMLDYVAINDAGDPQVDLSKLTRDQAAAMAEVTINTRVEKGGEDKPDAELKSVKFKLADKRAALIDLGKHLGMWKERVEHSGPNGGPIQTMDLSPTESARRIAFALARGRQRSKPQQKPQE